MQALGLVRISKKQDLVEISFEKISECRKLGLGQNITPEKKDRSLNERPLPITPSDASLPKRKILP